TLAVTFIVLLPVMVAAVLQLVRRPEDLDLQAHISEVGSSVRDVLIRFMFGMAVLPYEAYRHTDAIIRSNWRMIVTKRNLLEWTPSVEASRNTVNSVWSNYRNMWIGPTLALICLIFFLETSYESFFVASPILILWILSPALAWRLSIPEKSEVEELTEDQSRFLHKSARKTWLFFEKFVTAEENWLPPDNFQEHPEPKIAHRTSPTNMGLALLSNLTAYDFGYISSGLLITRSANTLETMHKMDRYQGHFYNWYDTRTLSTLNPRYVSTVDSGNLIGHLLTLRQGILGVINQPIFNHRSFEGLRTTLDIIVEIRGDQPNETIEKMLAVLDVVSEDTSRMSTVKSQLEHLMKIGSEWKTTLTESDVEQSQISTWLTSLLNQLQAIYDDFNQQSPWLA